MYEILLPISLPITPNLHMVIMIVRNTDTNVIHLFWMNIELISFKSSYKLIY